MSEPTQRAWAVSCLLQEQETMYRCRTTHTMQVVTATSEAEAKGIAIGVAMKEHKNATLAGCLAITLNPENQE